MPLPRNELEECDVPVPSFATFAPLRETALRFVLWRHLSLTAAACLAMVVHLITKRWKLCVRELAH